MTYREFLGVMISGGLLAVAIIGVAFGALAAGAVAVLAWVLR